MADKFSAITYAAAKKMAEDSLKGAGAIKGQKGDKGEKGDTGAQGAQGAQGAKGDPGLSPTITAQRVSGGVVLNITDANGTRTAELYDGAKGDTGATGAKGDKGDKGDPGSGGTGGSVDLSGYYTSAQVDEKIKEAHTEKVPEKWAVVVVAGQSNAVGYDESAPNALFDVPRDVNRVKQLGYYGDHNLQIVDLGFCAENFQDMRALGYKNGGTKGMHLPLANLLLDYVPEDYGVLVIPAAYGGTSFGDGGTYDEATMHTGTTFNAARWGVNGSNYKAMRDRLKYVLDLNEKNVLLGVIWVQGEHGANNPTNNNNGFDAMTNQFFTDFANYKTRTRRGVMDKTIWFNVETTGYWFQSVNGVQAIWDHYKEWNPDTYVEIPRDLDLTNNIRNVPDGTAWSGTAVSSNRPTHFGNNANATVLAPRIMRVMLNNGSLFYNGVFDKDTDTVQNIDMTAYDRSISELDEKILALEKDAALLNGTKSPAEPWRQAGEGDYQWLNSAQATSNTFTNGTFTVANGNGKSGLWFPKDCVAVRFTRAANSAQPVFFIVSQNETSGAHNALFVGNSNYRTGLWKANDTNSSFNGQPDTDSTGGLGEKLKAVQAGTIVEFRKMGNTAIRVKIGDGEPIDFDLATDTAQFVEGATVRFGFNNNWTGGSGYIATEIELYDPSAEDKTGVSTITLTAANWADIEGGGATYSLEADYPFEDYKVTVEPNGDALTAEQYDAWAAAKIVGSNTASQIKALGTKPTVDIPVIVTAARKPAIPKKLVKVNYVDSSGNEIKEPTSIDLLTIEPTEGDGFTDLKSSKYISPSTIEKNGTNYSFNPDGGINNGNMSGNHIIFGKRDSSFSASTSIDLRTIGDIKGYQARFIRNGNEGQYQFRQGQASYNATVPIDTEIFLIYTTA